MLGALERFGLLIDDLSYDMIVFDLGISVCKTSALLFLIAGRHFHGARHFDKS
jgi:hypothetical protein